MRTVIVAPACGTNYRSDGGADGTSDRSDDDPPDDPTDGDETSEPADR